MKIVKRMAVEKNFQEMQKNLTIRLPSGFSFDLIHVEGGDFDMGGGDPDASNREKPVHRVEVSTFYIGKYPVTQALWKEVVGGENPSRFEGDNRPVERVSWDDTREFFKKLNALTGKPFRLPTEAEWEYAARGGRHSQGYLYAGSDRLKQVGWFRENSGRETKEAGLLLANELGLYDMSGNVWEWCEDDWYDNYQGAPKNGSAWIDEPERGADRVLRGGSCFGNASRCRCAYRDSVDPSLRGNNLGFRLVLPFQSVG